MDTFNDAGLTPDQIKMLTLQFMGQHLTGELKELDKNLVAKNNTLQGMVLDPTAVIKSINNVAPQVPPQQQSAPLPQHVATQPLPDSVVLQQPPAPAAVQVAPQQNIDTNQLEFNFNTSPLSERIFESLQRIEKILLSLDERLLAIENTKKKD